MTEILRAFWKEKRPERIAVLVSGILFAVIFWIYEIPVEIAGYAFLLVILWNVIWFTLVFIRYEKRQRILEENQGKIRTEAGGFPEAESRESEMYQELIRQLYEEKKELESSVQIEKQELSDYYSMWVHQIKTPIAALGVLIQSGEELEEVQESPKAQELTRSMKMEAFEQKERLIREQEKKLKSRKEDLYRLQEDAANSVQEIKILILAELRKTVPKAGRSLKYVVRVGSSTPKRYEESAILEADFSYLGNL